MITPWMPLSQEQSGRHRQREPSTLLECQQGSSGGKELAPGIRHLPRDLAVSWAALAFEAALARPLTIINDDDPDEAKSSGGAAARSSGGATPVCAAPG